MVKYILTIPEPEQVLNPSQCNVFDRIVRAIESAEIRGILGPPGTGKTRLLAYLALHCSLNEGLAVTVTAGMNEAVDQCLREIVKLIGLKEAKMLVRRCGYRGRVSPDILPFFSNRRWDLESARIILTTEKSTYRLKEVTKPDVILLDETAQLQPEQGWYVLRNLFDFNSLNQAVITSGDPRQADPISPRPDKGILRLLMEKYPHKIDYLKITHRLPTPICELDRDVFYPEGLSPWPAIKWRRLSLSKTPKGPLSDVVDPNNPIVFYNFKGEEMRFGLESWYNPAEAKEVVRLCEAFINSGVSQEEVLVVTRYIGQENEIRYLLNLQGLDQVRIMTTTRALGQEADVVIFSVVRSNRERLIGASGNPEAINVAISRARCKLVIVGDFETFAGGWVYLPTENRWGRKSVSRKIARLIITKYGYIHNL